MTTESFCKTGIRHITLTPLYTLLCKSVNYPWHAVLWLSRTVILCGYNSMLKHVHLCNTDTCKGLSTKKLCWPAVPQMRTALQLNGFMHACTTADLKVSLWRGYLQICCGVDLHWSGILRFHSCRSTVIHTQVHLQQSSRDNLHVFLHFSKQLLDLQKCRSRYSSTPEL